MFGLRLKIINPSYYKYIYRFVDLVAQLLIRKLLMKTAQFFSRIYFLTIFFLIGLMYSAHLGGKQITQFSVIAFVLLAIWTFHIFKMNKRFFLSEHQESSAVS